MSPANTTSLHCFVFLEFTPQALNANIIGTMGDDPADIPI